MIGHPLVATCSPMAQHLSHGLSKKNSTSRSSCESEYRALAKSTCGAIWLRRLEKELGFSNSLPMSLWYDNQSSIKISKNLVFHDKTKHLEVDWHFSKQKIEDGTIKVSFISTNSQPTDIFIKALNKTKFENCRDLLGLRSLEDVLSSL